MAFMSVLRPNCWDRVFAEDKRQLTLHVRFKGGATQSLTLPRPLSAWELRMTPAATIAEIDRLLDHHTEGQIAVILNERGLRSGEGKPFHGRLVLVLVRRADPTYPRPEASL